MAIGDKVVSSPFLKYYARSSQNCWNYRRCQQPQDSLLHDSSWRVLIVGFSFLILLYPAIKIHIFTSLIWLTNLPCQKITSWIILMIKKPPPETRSHFPLHSLIFAKFYFFKNPYWQTHQTPSTYLKFYSGLFGTLLHFTCQSISTGKCPTKSCWHLTIQFHKMF